MDDYHDFELDSFHDLFSVANKDSMISLKQKDLKNFFKKYLIIQLNLTCRNLDPSSVFIKFEDIPDDTKAFDKIDAARNQAERTRLILTNYSIIFIKEMSTSVHARVTRFVERQILTSVLHHITLDPQGEPRTLELEFCGDGCKCF